ncbi:hypothetical protein D3C81_838820 [compost metagenome]
MAILTIDIVVCGATQLSIEAWVEGRLGRVVLLFGSGDVGFGRAQDRAVFQHLRAGFIQVGRHQRQETRRALQLIGHLADSGEVVGLGISQVGLLGDQVVARLGHPRLGLIEVGAATDATLGAQLDLVVNALVALEVVLGQAHEFAPGQHVEIDLGHGQPGTLGSTQQRIGTGVDGGLLTPYFAGRRKTVKNHLGQSQARFTAVQGFPVIVAAVSRRHTIGAFTTITAQQVDPWQVPAFRRLQLIISRQPAVDTCLDLRMDIQRLLHGFW